MSSLHSHLRKLHEPSAHHARLHPTEQTMSSIPAARLDPHAYTSGRWLRSDKLERDARYINFDFDALCRRLVELCPGATSVTTYDKKEGGFNRVFIFTTDNAKRIVARLPFVIAGPPRLTTNSEVATIDYLQTSTSIPIPKILDWSDDASNAIGSEYIIMEHAAGVQLHQKWPTMAGDQQVSSYGSLYLADAPLDAGSMQTLDQRFCIGPHCGAIYWNCNAGEPRYYHNTMPNHGPWPNLTAYCDGLIDSGISRVPLVDSVPHNRPRYYGSVEAHLRLLESGRAVVKKMSGDPRIQDAAVPTLLHPDLHKRNIFVSDEDPTVITGIIDWQSSSIEPAFWYADEVPDFASPVAHSSIENQLEPNSELCAIKTVCRAMVTEPVPSIRAGVNHL